MQPLIGADSAPIERQNSASFSLRACHVTFHTDIVRGYVTFDTFLIKFTLDLTICSTGRYFEERVEYITKHT